jgi:1,4-alpha-glucan branching enzyme
MLIASSSPEGIAEPVLGELDRHLLAEGTHWRSYERLGAHARTIDGVAGVAFSVWAPNAKQVNVIGEFNGWKGESAPMRLNRDCGIWELFMPGLVDGMMYKFEVHPAFGERTRKSDPFAFRTETPPRSASIIHARPAYRWGDRRWMAARNRVQAEHRPMSIYEVHLGSWRRHQGGKSYTYTEFADALIPYVSGMGFTHIEIMPVAEFPFGGSWGYQPTSLFAPSARWGTPDELRELIDRCHQAGIGVLLDWVAGHFPDDVQGLARFDGTCLYEHEDPRLGRHRDWNTLVYNFGRREVANFLISSALFWLREFHVDGLRVDAVASMLYLDYSRGPGEWVPNVFGGNENLEAVEFLRRLNAVIREQAPAGALMIAEESTAWAGVTRPIKEGGLGFDYKWNMGWMNDTLRYLRRAPVHRRFHHDEMTFGSIYAYSEKFILPLSHDEVVHGKRALLDKMPGERWEQFANLRLCLAWLFTQPGKKLLFMGGEFGQSGEWKHQSELEWHLLADPQHAGVQRMVGDLNRLYCRKAAMHAGDCDARGFRWIDCSDAGQSVFSYRRIDASSGHQLVVVCNFTPVTRHAYRVGVGVAGRYTEVFNSDGLDYGGSGSGNPGAIQSDRTAWHGEQHSLLLTLPPLAAIVLSPS